MLKLAVAFGTGFVGTVAAFVVAQDPTGWMRIWADVWGVAGPLFTLGVGGFITYYLQMLAKKQGIAVKAADEAKVAAKTAVAATLDAAQARDEHLRAQDAKLAEIHNAVEYTLSDAAQRVAVQAETVAQAHTDHLAAQDAALEQIHVAVNSQKVELERVNRALRDALTAAGIALPPGIDSA